MNLVTLKAVQHAFGGPPLLADVSLSIASGERVCLIGRNGEGKSTLMKIIAGEIRPDAGEVARAKSLRMARLTQEVPADFHGSVFAVVAGGLGETAELLNRYHAAVTAVADDPGEDNLERLAQAQHALEAADGWQLEQEVESVISRLSLDADTPVEALSGGLKRRVLLARALVTRPDLLLLDEPTNHLDLASIKWLEEFLLEWPGAILFVTHDRAFLRRMATRLVELDRGRATDWPGDYDNYLRRREERLHAEAKQNERFDRKLAQEEVWIRQGIKARRTRNEGRVRALKAMREAYRERRSQQGKASLTLQDAERSARLVCEVDNISYRWDEKPVIRDFSLTVMRGDRLGVIGPNGAGKSTLLNLLLGRLAPQQGSVKLGERLETLFFDQLRETIDEQKSVLDNVAEGSDKVVINGQQKHIMSYLQDFLFTPERARQPAAALSGGERNRLLLAKLFLKPANLLVLDEPTNDLDVETLELLEELLMSYQGTLILVSHDRDFLDNVVTSVLVLEGEGKVGHYVGGYSDWEARQSAVQTAAKLADSSAKPIDKTANSQANKQSGKQSGNQPVNQSVKQSVKQSGDQAINKPGNKRLSYKLQRELETLPETIESLEASLEQLQQQMADPALYRDQPQQVTQLQQQLADTESELAQVYARWEELEAMQ